MNLNKNYYLVLNSSNKDDVNSIKKSYYKLSKKYHPDLNDNPEMNVIFMELSEAWEILGNIESKDEYDKKSKFGKDYNEIEELFKVELEWNHKEAESNFDKVKNREVLDIIIKVDKDTFDGTLEFPRFVLCKTCKGTGKDMSTKIQIKGPDGKVKWFESDDECFICEGEGKDRSGQKCFYCDGNGKVGINPCQSCNSEGRTLGKQKLKDIKLVGEETKIESMGHYNNGRVGNLIIRTNI